MVYCDKGNPESGETQNYVQMGANEVDDDDEEGVYNGYEPLGMNDYEDDRDVNTDSDEEPNEQQEEATNAGLPHIEPVETTLVREVWSTPNSTDIPLDDNKIDQIKELMKDITLPHPPDWVKNDDLVNNLIQKSKTK